MVCRNSNCQHFILLTGMLWELGKGLGTKWLWLRSQEISRDLIKVSYSECLKQSCPCARVNVSQVFPSPLFLAGFRLNARHFKQDNMAPCFLLFSLHKPVTPRLWYPTCFIFTSRLIMCQHPKRAASEGSIHFLPYNRQCDTVLWLQSLQEKKKKPLEFFLSPLFSRYIWFSFHVSVEV